MIDNDVLAHANWRKSSFSGGGDTGGGDCVEMALLPDGAVALRNNKHPDAGVALFTRSEIAAWVKGCKAGEFDDLSTI